MHFFTAYHWEKGTRTEKNQDSLAIGQMVVRRKRCLLVLVCDGIGSLAKSEEASGFVTEQMLGWFYRAGPRVFGGVASSRKILCAGKRALHRVNRQLQEACSSPVGCTCSMILFVNRRFFVWNLGDSRIYQGRHKHCRQLTEDDVREGRLTRCLGSFSWQGTSTCKGKVKQKDCFLVCSDGFYGRLTKENLQELVGLHKNASERQLYRLLGEASARCLRRGETDDRTAVLVQAGGRSYPGFYGKRVTNREEWRNV